MTKDEKKPVVEETYVGNYYDILGHRGDIRFELQSTNTTINGKSITSYNGTCEIILIDIDEPVIFKGVAQNLLDGFVKVENNSGGILKLAFVQNPQDINSSRDISSKDLSITAEISLLNQVASPFARQAIYGILDAPEGESGLGGGVWIAWQFTDTQ